MTALRPSSLMMTTFVFAAAALFAATAAPLLQIAARVVI
jgi:hypothetical protein